MAFNVDSSLHKASDLIHEFTCSPCEEDGLYSEAQNFCVDCSKYYCYRCEPKHGGLFKRYSVLGRKDVKKWAAVPWTIVDDLERCEHHRGKKWSCSAEITKNCVAKYASTFFTDVAKGIYDKPEVKRLPQQIANIQSQIKKQTGSRKNQQQCIRDSRTRILQEIRTLRSTIDNALNQLEQNTIKEMDVMVATLEQQIKTNIKQFAQFSKDIKSLAGYIAKGKMDDSLAYVGYSKCQKLIRETNAFVEDNKTKEKVNLEFVLNTGQNDVIAPLLSLRWFGEITDTSHVFTTEHVKRFNTAITSDREHNTISGICELIGGELVLVDNFNSCIKLLNQVYKVVDHCDVPTHPRDVCHIAGNELAVSVNSNIENRHEVRFFNVMNSKLQQTRKITFSHSVLKIAHHKGRMYIASGTALYSYDKALSVCIILRSYVEWD